MLGLQVLGSLLAALQQLGAQLAFEQKLVLNCSYIAGQVNDLQLDCSVQIHVDLHDLHNSAVTLNMCSFITRIATMVSTDNLGAVLSFSRPIWDQLLLACIILRLAASCAQADVNDSVTGSGREVSPVGL